MRRKLIWALAILGVVIVALGIIAATFDFDGQRERLVGVMSRELGRAVQIDGHLKVVPSLVPTISVERLALANMPTGSRPQMATIDRLEVQVAMLPLLRGDVRIRKIVVEGADLLLERDAEGRTNWAFGAPNAGVSDTPQASSGSSFSVASISLRGTRLTYRDAKSQSESLVQVGHLDIGPSDGTTRYEGEAVVVGRHVALDLEAADIEKLAAGSPTPLKGTLVVDDVRLAVDGSVKAPLDLKGVSVALKLEAPSLEVMGKLLGAKLPPLSPADLVASVSDDAAGWVAKDLVLRVGASSVSGDARLNIEDRPRLDATLKANLIDVDALSGPPSGTKRADDGRAIPPTKITFGPLPAADARVALAAKSVRVGGLDLVDLNAVVSLDPKGIAIDPMEFGLAKGRVTGTAGASRADVPDLSLKAKASGIDMHDLLSILADTQAVTGRLDADVSVAGKGRTLREVASGLNGRTFVALGRGTIASKWLDFVAADLVQAISPMAPSRDDTQVTCAVSRMDFARGKGVSKALLFDTSRITITGDGNVDLGTERISFALAPRPKDRSLLSLATDLDISGTIRRPVVRPTPLGLLRDAAKVAGGVALGPLGLLLPLATSGNEERNPCIEALAAKGAPSAPKGGGKAAPEDSEGTLDKIGKGIGGAFDDIGSAINPF